MGEEVLYVRQGVPPEKKQESRRASLVPRLPSDARAKVNDGDLNGGEGGDDLGEALLMTLKGHEAAVTALCILEHYLISVGADHSIRVWDSNTGRSEAVK
jgi:WD40 repeat protein